MDSDAEDIIQEMLITVYSQAHFARLFDGRNSNPPLPLQKNADGKLFLVMNFADLAYGGIYTGRSESSDESDRLMLRVSQVESYILRQNTDFEKLVSTKIRLL